MTAVDTRPVGAAYHHHADGGCLFYTSTHGVMRFRVSLEGEIIDKIDAKCGYIHRGIEKMCESLTYPQTLAPVSYTHLDVYKRQHPYG